MISSIFIVQQRTENDYFSELNNNKFIARLLIGFYDLRLILVYTFHLTEGGGSQPERPDTPIDIEIPFVAESEEAIADKVCLTNAYL